MSTKPTTALPDYQQQFSKRSIKNYIAAFFAPFGNNGLSTMLFSTYLTFVYTEYLGVGTAAIASVVSVGVIVDGVASAEAVKAINFLSFSVPALSMTVAFILCMTWTLNDEKTAVYRAEVEERRNK